MAKISIEQCIKTSSEMMEEMKYKTQRAKDPGNKRTYQRTFDFWESINEHLQSRLS